MAFFDCGGTRLMLSPAEQPESTYSSIIYYRTDDIRKTAELLRSRSVAQVRIRAEDDRQDAGSRVVDGVFPRFGRNLAGLMSEVSLITIYGRARLLC